MQNVVANFIIGEVNPLQIDYDISQNTDVVANFTIEQNDFLQIDYDISQSENINCIFDVNVAKAYWGKIRGNINNQTDLITILNNKVDIIEFEQEIDDINERIDETLNNIDGSELIGVERDNQTVTITSKTFVFEQGVASNEWNIVHNLNKRPSIQLVDSSGKGFEAEKKYVNNNQVIIKLESATTGKAYLN